MSTMREYKETSHTLARKTIADLALYSVGHEACAPGHAYGPTVRAYQLIHFVVSGQGELDIEGNTFRIGPRSAFVIPAGSISHYHASEDDPWTYAWMGFLGVNSHDYTHMLMSTSPERYVLRDIDVDWFVSSIEQTLSLGSSTRDYLRANAKLLDMLAELFQRTGFDERYWEREGVAEKARFELEMRFSQHITIQEIARGLGVHPNYLTRCFRKRYGATPKRYLTGLRMDRAKVLLRESVSSVSVIAASLGYDDQFAFAKAFRQEVGMTPSDWRAICPE